MDEDQQIAAFRASIREIGIALETSSDSWQSFLASARGAMAAIDATRYMRRDEILDDQIWLVQGLQNLASQEPDVGVILDISEWCLRNWLIILQDHSDSVEVLKGIGRNWLSRAQAPLARIHRQEANSSSSGDSTSRSFNPASFETTRSEDDREAARQAAEAEGRLGLPDYVEARGILNPATEYFNLAVEYAREQNILEGDLLSLTAEAYMSFGNVSYSRINETYYQRAITFLREASAIEGYTLSPYLQQYLDDFGGLLE
ncbi:MAG: hypothetical protein M1820_008574 [Bogoriella megaspora]|nr:MAG: hypothetical protein M1820_008574 [Bogoriella megaspora]